MDQKAELSDPKVSISDFDHIFDNKYVRVVKWIRQSRSQARKGVRRAADPQAFCVRYVVPAGTRIRRAVDPPPLRRLFGDARSSDRPFAGRCSSLAT